MPTPTSREGTRAAAIAASGSTVTTRPAVAGDIPQPETSRSTSRKSAATRPPERKSSAAFALRCGRPGETRERALDGPAERKERRKWRESERYLHEEDRPPAEQLGQDAARARPERRAEDARRYPDACRARTAPRRLGQEIERGDDDERCSDRLDAARCDEHLERPCEPAGQGRGREDQRAGDECPAWAAPGQQRGRNRDKREHEVEGREHPGNGRDPDVEASEDLRQRERDDRGVREREPDG